VTLLLATLLGSELLLISLAALTVIEMGLIWAGGRGTVAPVWNALVTVMLPWLAGHIAFGPLSPISAGLALALALAWAGILRIESVWGRAMHVGGQLLAAALLVVVRHPLAAGCSVLLLAPQVAMLPWVLRNQSSSWHTRHGRLWLMAAMLVAAIAL
jgi:hypothetical protein